MNWFNGMLVVTYKDGTTEELPDVEFYKAARFVEEHKTSIENALYHPSTIALVWGGK